MIFLSDPETFISGVYDVFAIEKWVPLYQQIVEIMEMASPQITSIWGLAIFMILFLQNEAYYRGVAALQTIAPLV